MLAIEIHFRYFGGEVEAASFLVSCYVSALAKNGNILDGWVMTANGGGWCVHAVAPDRGALRKALQSRFCRQYLAGLKAAKVTVSRVRYLDQVHEGETVCGCEHSAGYFLFTTFLHVEPPVRCMSCGGFVPLYLLPAPENGDFSALFGWQADYQACDTLQMNCTVGERFAERQMSSLESSLTRSGLAVCSMLTALTGRPVFY